MKRLISKKDLYKQLSALSGDFEIIGPQELPQKGIFYKPIDDIEILYLGEGFTTEPVKKFFLNQSEYLFKGNYEQGKEVLEAIELPKNKRIIIGVRPCEARGLTLLDNIFNDKNYKDEFYINNRNRTILIGLACLKPDKNCFCTSLGGSPAESRGLDAMILPRGNDFVVEIFSDKAIGLFKNIGKDITEEETKTLETEKEKIKGKLIRKIKAPQDLDKIFESDYWNHVSRSCISCGICTFLCPTCHCFDLVDEERKRLRCYDGCAFCDFTMEASGVNPRPTKKERYRQRVMHKFNYFKKNFGENLCVGCGRCIRFCPVKIDIAKVANDAPLTK